MMQAMLIGESSKLQKIWTENFRRTGTFHALVISGAHVAVLAGVLLFLLRICSLGEIPALTLTAAATWLYALVSGFSPPVARAAAGFTLYLVARFFFRRGRVLNLLAAVAVVYLLCDPGDLGRCQFPVVVPMRSGARRTRRAPAGSNLGPFHAWPARYPEPRSRSPSCAQGCPVPHRDPAGGRNARSLVPRAGRMVRGGCGAARARRNFCLRNGPGLACDPDRLGSAHGGLLPSHIVHGPHGQRDHRAAARSCRAYWIPGYLQRDGTQPPLSRAGY